MLFPPLSVIKCDKHPEACIAFYMLGTELSLFVFMVVCSYFLYEHITIEIMGYYCIPINGAREGDSQERTAKLLYL